MSKILTKPIKEARRLKVLNKYRDLDVASFIKGKVLYIEKVKPNSRVLGVPCIKIDVRIIEDSRQEGEPDNQGKVFTIRIDKEDDISDTDFKEMKDEYVALEKHIAMIDLDEVVDTYLYNTASLTIIVELLEASDEKAQLNDKYDGISNKDRMLVGLNNYIGFNVENFLNDYRVNIMGCFPYKGVKMAHFNALVIDRETDEPKGYLIIEVPVEDYENYPFKLLGINGDFRDIVEQYDHAYTIPTNRGNRWKMVFDSITFKRGVIYDETTLTVDNIEK